MARNVRDGKSRETKSWGETFRSQQNESWIRNPRVGIVGKMLILSALLSEVDGVKLQLGGEE